MKLIARTMGIFSRDELSCYEDVNDSDDERALNEASDSGFTSEEEEE